jgi:ABC-type antimicrobial peptide transport system permease subunit
VTGSYFDALAIPILKGRAFDAHDSLNSTKVAIVNEAMAEKYWPNRDPLGARVTVDRETVQIVGIARTVKNWGLMAPPMPFVYFPLEQSDPIQITLFVAARSNPAALASVIRREVNSIDPNASIHDVRTMVEIVRQSAADDRTAAEIFTAVAVTGIVLAAFGLYSVVAYFVSQRTHEIGLRIALGASGAAVVRMVMKQGLKPIAVGIAGGIPVVFALRALVDAFPFLYAPADPVKALVYVIPLLMALALFACYLPARRASRVDPNASLRCE